VNGQLNVFAPIYATVGKMVVERIFDGIICSVLKRKSDMEIAVNGVVEIAKANVEFAKQVHQGQMLDKQWLQTHIDRLAFENRSALRELPEPVGRSVRQIKVGNEGRGVVIDEADAEVLRSRDENLVVGETSQYRVRIEGVFKTDGSCRLLLIDENRVVSGKITDPALWQAKNVYTQALNDGTPLLVTTKPTLLDGIVKRLYISDAVEVT
jgi:hypothetical protein